MKPTVSVVIPAFNNAEYIEATMRSVLGQTFQDFELIVADHSSTDATAELLRQFESDPRVRLISTPAGGGAARNWRRVTAEASGEYIKLVCGDDIIYPQCIDTQLNSFSDGVNMVSARRDVVDSEGRTIVSNRGLPGLVGRIAGTKAVRATVRSGTNVFGEPASVMFRRSALVNAGSWDTAEHYLIDEATYVSVLMDGDHVGIAESLGSFRVSDSQWSVRLAKTQAREAIAFHRRLAAAHPELLSPFDVWVGNLKARVLALGRRLIYVALAIRKTLEKK